MGTVKSSVDESNIDIKFGSFGIEDSLEVTTDANIPATVIESVESAPVKVAAPTFVPATYAPIRVDTLNKLKKIEQEQQTRFRQVNAIPGRLNLRLGKDHFMGSLLKYSLEALYECLSYVELPSEIKERPDIKTKFLKRMFDFDNCSGQSLEGIKNSFLHPICVDAMKYMGDSIQNYQIDWLIQHVPNALFDNFELISTLTDYSFFTLAVFENCVHNFKTLSIVDFLSIPAFVKTGPVDLLMGFLTTVFEPSRHWKILLEHRGLDDLVYDKSVAENPINYPFLVGIASLEYLLDSSDIIAKIRRNGLTKLALASLIAYVQDSNDAIQNLMTEIATTWAELHKNSHLNASLDVSKEFNERIQNTWNSLMTAKNHRENLNNLIKDFEDGEIPAHPTIIKLYPDWLKSLKLLVQTPFNAFMRTTFSTRCAPFLMTPIHPIDEENLVKLPRLTRNDMCGIYLQADPNLIYSPFIWNSLWRNIFSQNGEDWRNDPKIKDLNDKEIEEYLKTKFEFIYRDKNYNSIHLLEAWTKLSIILPDIYSRGPRLFRFIASISVPAPPEGIEIPRDQAVLRKVFAKKVAAATDGEVRLVDKVSIDIIKFNLSDSEEVVNIMEKLSQIVPNGPSGFNLSIKSLETLCANFNMMMNVNTFPAQPSVVFHFLKRVESGFATLGLTLSENQIKEIGENKEINTFLARHGRALLRTQVVGLLKSDWGRMFLKSNKPMLTSLIDYSAFKPGDFEDLGVNVDEIRINLATAPTSVKLLNLNKKGFANVDEPLALVYSLGYSVWTDTNNFKNLALWELLNPIVLAYDLDMTADCALIYHMTGLKHKLHGKVLLELALVFITKWLIAQDWYAFVYHMAISKGSEYFGPAMIRRLTEIYPKYLAEGELPGRKNLVEWLNVAEYGRTIEGKDSKDELMSALAGLSVGVDAAPLTPFREIVNQSSSTVAELLAEPFYSTSHSPNLLRYVQSVVMKHFKPNDKLVWLNRLDILSEFSVATGGMEHYPGSSAVIRTRLQTLPTFDALIYKWSLEFEGVCVESLFRDTNRSDLEIDPKAPGAVPKRTEKIEIETAETAKSSGNRNETKKANKKKNKKK